MSLGADTDPFDMIYAKMPLMVIKGEEKDIRWRKLNKRQPRRLLKSRQRLSRRALCKLRASPNLVLSAMVAAITV